MSPLVVLFSLFASNFVNCVVSSKDDNSKNMDEPDLKACGIPPKLIDMRKYRCIHGIAVPRITPSTPSTVNSSSNITRKPSLTYDSCRYTDLLNCDGTIHCGAENGYQCCGFERYQPAFQTCCRLSSAKYKIHNNTQEREHVCCGLKVYKRGYKGLPCEHPSSNDKFSRKLASLKRSIKWEKTRCDMDTHGSQFVYKIDINYQSSGNVSRPFLRATISEWSLRSTSRINLRKTSSLTGDKKIPFDAFSKFKKKLVGRSYFTVTAKNYLDNVIFFLNPSDNLYQWPKRVKKQRRLIKMLTKIQKHCNRWKPMSARKQHR